MMQYAFVDSVATLEKEKHVLTRSKRLTKSRRKSLVMLIGPFVLLGQGMQLVDLLYSSNLPALIGFHSLYEGLFLVITSTFYMLYHETNLVDRTTQGTQSSETSTAGVWLTPTLIPTRSLRSDHKRRKRSKRRTTSGKDARNQRCK